jgi:hypothetical protein
MRIAILVTLAFALSWLLMYGALKTAEKIAVNQMEVINSYEKH